MKKKKKKKKKKDSRGSMASFAHLSEKARLKELPNPSMLKTLKEAG
jgi:hypothetical protein